MKRISKCDILQVIVFTLLNLIISISHKAVAQGNKSIALPPIFSDNMVLQQGVAVPVWGGAIPSSKVKVTVAENTAEVRADENGKWMVYLPAMSAGGPYQLVVKGNDSLSFKNVMIGEVWFASGQSNMNFTIDRPVENSERVIANANYPNIREFKVKNTSSRTPTSIYKGSWAVCSPENVKKFSAVAYFFARQLHADKKVAVGIIHSSYSGTPIEAWISADYLVTHPDFKDTVNAMVNDTTDWSVLNRYAATIDSLRNAIVNKATNGLIAGVTKLVYNDANWKSIDYPLKASRMNVPAYSLVWARRVIEIPRHGKPADLYLHLGTVIRKDITYFNGVEIGRSNEESQRKYIIPRKLIRKGKNVIAVMLLNEWSNGRIGNFVDAPFLSSIDSSVYISLKGHWKYNSDIEPALPVASSNKNQPTGLFNAMVFPIIPYAIKGFLWYQGESNAGRPQQYKSLLPLMVADWRIHWKQGDLPFIFVQLPDYSNSIEWAQLREAQASLLKYPNTGMAVTIDVGDSTNIHPAKKEQVGYRLWLAAKKIAYHDSYITLGPVLKSYRVSLDSVSLNFIDTRGGLTTKGNGTITGFTIAGENQKFYPAKAIIRDKSSVILYSENVSRPLAVRYAWTGNLPANLYDNEGMPCIPFRTDNWQFDSRLTGK